MRRVVIETPKNSLKWNDEMDTILLDALIEEQNNENRPKDVFSTTAYKNVIDTCIKKLQVPLTKANIKNHVKVLKEKFGVVYDIFKSYSGFSWSLLTKRFEAEDEVWDQLIQWKYIEIQNFDKLYDLFAKDRATGKGAVSAREKVQRWEANFIQNVTKDGVENNNNEGYNPQSLSERTS
uniref:Uncharacterized protein At2g29880-like n=1 Tax=Elaeis guineensis var. tenera TaxID=51953 RepID=A0A6J0PEL4_ELAGV|nr:uncharacterized protein At2g29880-like [Elaeis guineensis]